MNFILLNIAFTLLFIGKSINGRYDQIIVKSLSKSENRLIKFVHAFLLKLSAIIDSRRLKIFFWITAINSTLYLFAYITSNDFYTILMQTIFLGQDIWNLVYFYIKKY